MSKRTDVIHVRRGRGAKDKRFRISGGRRLNNVTSTLCGGTPTDNDVSRRVAQHVAEHFAGMPQAERLCESCMDEMGW